MQGAGGSFTLLCVGGTLMLTGGGSQVWVPFTQTHLGGILSFDLLCESSRG